MTFRLPRKRVATMPFMTIRRSSGLFLLLGVSMACRGEAEPLRLAGSLQAQGADVAQPQLADREASSTLTELRRLWTGEDFNFYVSSPSPDGRWVTDVDWNTGNLAVRDLKTGQLHHVTDDGSWEKSAQYAEVSRFSPDGRRLAYDWYNGDTDLYEVRILDFDVDPSGKPRGSNVRVVYPGGELFSYWIYGWSESDELLTGVYRPDNTFALAFLSIETGSLRMLKSFDWRDAHAALSPDDQWVAYDHPPGTDSGNRDIWVLSADGARETKVVEGSGMEVVLGWHPSDGSLLFYRDGPGTPSIWSLPMSAGRPAGEPVLVRRDVRNLEPLGFAGNNYYYGVEVEAPAFRTAAIDIEQRRLTVLPERFEAPYGGDIRALAWSPDGRYVVHDVEGRVGTRIYLRRANGEVIREWNFDVRMPRWLIRWAPNGDAVFLPGIDERGRAGFYRIDLEAGEAEFAVRLDAATVTDRTFEIAPDGRRLYYVRSTTPEGTDFAIVEHDLESGREQRVHDTAATGPLLVSPDGTVLAWHGRATGTDNAIHLYPVDGGEPRVLFRAQSGHVDGLVGWTPDGESVLFLVVTNGADGPVNTLWSVSKAGDDAEQIADLPDYAGGGVRLHPDGRRIAYRAGRLLGEVWSLDGLLESPDQKGDGR
jgi:Tol biopolymer transport system component